MKSDFYIDRVDKEYSKNLLYNYHYLKDESKDFKSGYNYGLLDTPTGTVLLILVGVLPFVFLLGSLFQKSPKEHSD